MFCVPTPAVFSYYTGAIGDNTPWKSLLLREIARTEFVIMIFVCFVCTAEFGVNEIFVLQRLRFLVKEQRLLEKYGVTGPLPDAMRDAILQRGLLQIIEGCAVDPVNAILAFAHSGKIGWTAPDALGWFLYEFDKACIINVPEWSAAGQKRGRAGKSVVGTARLEISPAYVAEFCEAGMSHAYAQAVWDRNRDSSVGLTQIPLLD